MILKIVNPDKSPFNLNDLKVGRLAGDIELGLMEVTGIDCQILHPTYDRKITIETTFPNGISRIMDYFTNYKLSLIGILTDGEVR